MVSRVVVTDVYCWMTEEGDPARRQHNSAARGDLIEVSSEEAERGEGLNTLADPDSAPETGSDDDSEGDDEPVRPARAASKESWVDYAVANGADRDEAEGMTKADLIDTYGD